jgi:hypothetical protein
LENDCERPVNLIFWNRHLKQGDRIMTKKEGTEADNQKTKKSIFKKWWFWVLAILIIGGLASQQGQDGTDSTSTASSGNDAKPSAVVSNRGAQQADFIKIVQEGQTAAKGAENDMQRGGHLATRGKALCSLLQSKKVENWTGWVDIVDSNSDGKGVFAIKVARDIHLSTWNNSFSDIGAETLLEPGSPVFSAASTLNKRQEVKFSGEFITDETHCLDEQSLSLDGKVSDPEFTFRFSEVSPL